MPKGGEVLQKADFRNTAFLAKFITDTGRIASRRRTGLQVRPSSQAILALENVFGRPACTIAGVQQIIAPFTFKMCCSAHIMVAVFLSCRQSCRGRWHVRLSWRNRWRWHPSTRARHNSHAKQSPVVCLRLQHLNDRAIMPDPESTRNICNMHLQYSAGVSSMSWSITGVRSCMLNGRIQI